MRKGLFMASLLLGMMMTWQRCDDEETPEPVDCADNPVLLTLVSSENPACNAQDGSIEVRATGGSGNFRYQLDGGSEQTSATFSNLGAGVYEITAVDENNCSSTMEASLQNVDGMNISFETTPSGCKGSEGSIEATAFDGTPPYQFKLNNGAAGDASTFSGLQGGEHDLVVSDASGCEVQQTVRIRTGVSFSASISTIIKNECAVSGCHNGTRFPDFRVFKNVHDNAGRIKTLTGNRTMPQGGTLTQEEIDMIACWVDDGALEN